MTHGHKWRSCVCGHARSSHAATDRGMPGSQPKDGCCWRCECGAYAERPIRPMALHQHRQATDRIPGPHVIVHAGYVEAKRLGLSSDLATLECSCGWSGKAGMFAIHRAEHGQPNKWASGGAKRVPVVA